MHAVNIYYLNSLRVLLVWLRIYMCLRVLRSGIWCTLTLTVSRIFSTTLHSLELICTSIVVSSSFINFSYYMHNKNSWNVTNRADYGFPNLGDFFGIKVLQSFHELFLRCEKTQTLCEGIKKVMKIMKIVRQTSCWRMDSKYVYSISSRWFSSTSVVEAHLRSFWLESTHPSWEFLRFWAHQQPLPSASRAI